MATDAFQWHSMGCSGGVASAGDRTTAATTATGAAEAAAKCFSSCFESAGESWGLSRVSECTQGDNKAMTSNACTLQ